MLNLALCTPPKSQQSLAVIFKKSKPRNYGPKAGKSLGVFFGVFLKL